MITKGPATPLRHTPPLLHILLCLVGLVGCSHVPQHWTVPREINVPSTTMRDKIPLYAGLYIAPQLRTLRIPQDSTVPIERANIFVGDALAFNAERIVTSIFEGVVILDAMEGPASSTGRQYDVIVVPQLQRIRNVRGTDGWLAQTVLKWNVLSPDGKEIYLSTIASDEVTRALGYTNQTMCDNRLAAIVASIQDHFQKARTDLYTSGWWKTPWWRASK
jgi:hypothetical protein